MLWSSSVIMNASPGGIVACLLFAFTGFFLAATFITWRRLRHFPGPFLSGVSYYHLYKACRSGKGYLKWYDLNNTYGPMVRIGPEEVLTDDPEIIRHMSSARSVYRRSKWYDAIKINPHAENLGNTRDIAAHDKLKAKMASGYSGKGNPSLEAAVDSQIESFISLIRRKYLSTETTVIPLDLGHKMQYLTMDVITKLAYGEEFGYSKTDSDVHEFLQNTEDSLPFLQICGDIPLFRTLFLNSWFLKLAGPKIGDKKGIGKLMG
jgi:hypothetical protein